MSRTGMTQSECIRVALLEYLQRQETWFPAPIAAATAIPVAPASVVPAAPGELRRVIIERPPGTAPLRQRGPQPLSRMTDEEKAAMIERIAKGGAEKERG